MHVQDFEVPAFCRLGFFKSGLFEKIATFFEGVITRRFDSVSTICYSMLDRLKELGVARSKRHFIPNWVDIETIQPLARAESLKSRFNIPEDKIVMLYSGNLGEKQGLGMVIKAADILKNSRPEMLFVIVGDGAARQRLENDAEIKELGNVHFHPLQPLEDLPALLATADVHLVVQKRGAADVVMPSKLTGILAAGGTALITADPDTELGRLIEKFPGIGVLVEPEDVSAFIEGVDLAIEKQKASGYPNPSSREYAENYLNIHKILKSLEKEMESLH